MGLPEQIARHMSLREPQREALEILDGISAGLDYRATTLDAVAALAGEKSRATKPVAFDTEFPSFCFALATGVGKTRLMGAMICYLWRSKGYRDFFVLAPNITIYDKLRAELSPAHAKYMFTGLSEFPRPDVYDGDNYLRFRPEPTLFDEKQARVFVFNIGKIFSARTDTEFKFHRFNEYLGNSFSAMLREMPDLVVLMDESHRYRGEASLRAINALRPALGLEFTATPKYEGNVVYSFGLAQAVGRFVKTPVAVTRTNLTTSDKEEIDRLKLLDGMTRHEAKKGRLIEYCEANGVPLVRPFVLISTRDTAHASEVRALVESESFCDGRYRGKVIEIHSGKTGAESDENVQRLLSVEQPTSDVEVVVHVNMLKEGWDVKNLYTIIPLRASTSEILTEQTLGRGLRLPFGKPTGDPDLDSLEVISHDQYARLIEEANRSSLFKVKVLQEDDLRPVKTVAVQHGFVDLDKVLDRLAQGKHILFTSELTDEKRLNEVVRDYVAEEAARYGAHAGATAASVAGEPQPAGAQGELFSTAAEASQPRPFDPEAAAEQLKKRLLTFAHANIDLPDIAIECTTERKLEPFQVSVNRGPFALVEQKEEFADLSSGRTRTGDRLEVMDVENPRGFLAGRLIDAVEELSVETDKDTALALVESYLTQLSRPSEELGRIVHLYRDVIIDDLRGQLEAHLRDETTAAVTVRSGFIKFRPGYSKTILAKDGVVPYAQQVSRSDVRRYLFEGFTKSFYAQVPFDSTPEKDFAALLERDADVLKWVRPPEGNIPIIYRGGSYTPDFLVETAAANYMVEIKARGELEPAIAHDVRGKALAAIRYCQAASEVRGGKRWEYKLIPDDVVGPGTNLGFVLSHAVKPA